MTWRIAVTGGTITAITATTPVAAAAAGFSIMVSCAFSPSP
jgi:hypothetical protein